MHFLLLATGDTLDHLRHRFDLEVVVVEQLEGEVAQVVAVRSDVEGRLEDVLAALGETPHL